jgi:hypothetical protein
VAGQWPSSCVFPAENAFHIRNRAIVDVPTDHPSCSKQHAVLQYDPPPPTPSPRTPYIITSAFVHRKPRVGRYRLHVTETVASGLVETVRPYLIDLETTNGPPPPLTSYAPTLLRLHVRCPCTNTATGRHVSQVRCRVAAHGRRALLRTEGRYGPLSMRRCQPKTPSLFRR